MAMDEAAFAELTQAFSSAALDPSQWRPAMSKLADALGAVGCALELSDLTSGEAVIDNTAQLDGDLARLYEDRIFAINPRIRRAVPLRLGAIADDASLVDRDDPANGEFFDWLSRTPYYYLIGGKILAQDGAVGFLTANFSQAHGMATAEHHKVFAALTPHLINTMSAARAITRRSLRGEALTLEALGTERAFAFLSADGRLVEASVGFEVLLRAQDTLRLRQGELTADRPGERRMVETFLAAAVGRRSPLAPPAPIRLRGTQGVRGLVLRAAPLAPRHDAYDIFRPAALLTLTDLDQPHRVRRGDLESLFGLTEREAEIAARLVEGATLERTAAGLEISEHTVRQHLKSVFGKVGVTRQAELVAVVSRLT